jgi:hypothetical protein
MAKAAAIEMCGNEQSIRRNQMIMKENLKTKLKTKSAARQRLKWLMSASGVAINNGI